MADIFTLEKQIKLMIDDLKGLSASNGLANQASEEVVILLFRDFLAISVTPGMTRCFQIGLQRQGGVYGRQQFPRCFWRTLQHSTGRVHRLIAVMQLFTVETGQRTERTVDFGDLGRTGFVVKRIDVLSDDHHSLLISLFEFGQYPMAGIRFGREYGAVNRSDRRVKLFGTTLKEINIENFCGSRRVIKTARRAKIGNPAFGRDAGSGEDRDPFGISQKIGKPFKLVPVEKHHRAFAHIPETKEWA